MVIPAEVACIPVLSSGFLVQTPADTTVTLAFSNATITMQGTIYINHSHTDQVSIATIEGMSVVGATSVARIVRPGGQITLVLREEDDSRVKAISAAPYPYDNLTLQNAPLDDLPRAVTLPEPIAPPPGYTPPPTISPTATQTLPPVAGATVTPLPAATATPCVPREDWAGQYVVQRGDTLSIIARNFEMDVTDLQLGNCIVNPDRIRVGQVLLLPGGILPVSETPETLVESVTFKAARATLQAGQCTTVDWQVVGAEAVYFEDDITTDDNSRQVCPSSTSNYTLRVVYPDGRQENYTLTVTVES